MKTSVPREVDVRGFRWALAMLERRRARLLDEAALRLAQADRERRAWVAELDRAVTNHAEQRDAAVRLRAASVDPVACQCALAFLAASRARMEVTRDALQRAERQCEEARISLQRADRELQVVGKLREAALADFGLDQQRRQARDADLAWIARGATQGGGR